ncbi:MULTISPECIES: hypothetical protein [Bradyrhizobium]|uniref:hypothetical protein n=1 Tax=Bradyrhizobium TaxID=374 RepID=UPI0013A59A4C|nr:hypothetical protein [Bradyrhizobium diazoefficiens]QJS41042.1 hypothetical protein DI395_46265 [Bradyrhizobium diazoefficiens]
MTRLYAYVPPIASFITGRDFSERDFDGPTISNCLKCRDNKTAGGAGSEIAPDSSPNLSASAAFLNLSAACADRRIPGDCIVRNKLSAARHYSAWSRCILIVECARRHDAGS